MVSVGASPGNLTFEAGARFMPNSGNSVSVNGHGERRPHPPSEAQERKELSRDFSEPPPEDWNKQSPEVLKKNNKLTAREVASILNDCSKKSRRLAGEYRN